MVDNKDGTFNCSYKPLAGSKHTVQVNYGGVPVKDSPFRVFVAEPTNASNVLVFGPGVEKGVKSNAPTHFNIDCRQAGPGTLLIVKILLSTLIYGKCALKILTQHQSKAFPKICLKENIVMAL